MDKNIAAILRNDTRTVSVTFSGGASKTYTYITNFDFKVGDFAIVEVSGDYKVVEIVAVAPDLRIQPNSDIHFKWIVDKLDLTEHEINMRRNAEIEQTLSQAYQRTMRTQLAQNLLANLSPEARESLTPLLG